MNVGTERFVGLPVGFPPYDPMKDLVRKLVNIHKSNALAGSEATAQHNGNIANLISRGSGNNQQVCPVCKYDYVSTQ